MWEDVYMTSKSTYSILSFVGVNVLDRHMAIQFCAQQEMRHEIAWELPDLALPAVDWELLE
jgi:hypothetical protein